MNVDHWWDDYLQAKHLCLERNLTQCPYVHNKSNMESSGVELEHGRWKSSEWPLELLSALRLSTMPWRQSSACTGTRCKRLKATNSFFSREALIFYGFWGNFLISLSSELQIQQEVSQCFHILCTDNDVGGGMKQIMKNVEWTTWKKEKKNKLATLANKRGSVRK
jgi:hypothetical protein